MFGAVALNDENTLSMNGIYEWNSDKFSMYQFELRSESDSFQAQTVLMQVSL